MGVEREGVSLQKAQVKCPTCFTGQSSQDFS